MTTSTNETQYQMSNDLYLFLIEYLKQEKLSLKKFCEMNNLNLYVTNKVVDRKIKMHIYKSSLLKIATITGAINSNIYR